ncbi:Cytochrome P450 [Macleaya cordata]|uniref:Cytochrome P450 n=1 Tax=Macleaya cordata TaxID=56857 RepID=A0A200PSD1_MACCD|nr:Cytochrome P450 [Macleaya cordata]
MSLTNQTIFSIGKITGNISFMCILPEIQFYELFVALVLFVSLNSLRQQKRHGLPVWPFFGMFPSLLIGIVQTEFYEWLTNVLQRQNYSTITYKGTDSFDCVFTADPGNVEHLLRTKFSNFPKGEFFRTKVHDLLGDGIFNTDEELWRRQRKMASIAFHSAEFRNLTTESLIELVHSRLLPVLEEQSASPIDLQDILLRLTFDNVCMIVFGVDPACLRLGLPEIPLVLAFEDAMELLVLRFAIPTFILKAMKYLNMGVEKKLKRSVSQVDKFAEEVIHTRKKELASDLSNDKKSRSDLLTMFMRLKDDEGNMLSDKFLRDICVNLIIAGRDSSSVALSWFFWLLDQNPTVEKQILQEICGIIAERAPYSDEELSKSSVEHFRPEEVKKMGYLQAAISEALRLYPSVPLDHKEV